METPQSPIAQDLFGVGVRLAALYLFFQGYESLLDAVYVRAAWSPSTYASVEGQLLYAFGYSA